VRFSPELFDSICEQIAEGKSLRQICAKKTMPSRVAFYKWLKADPDLVNQYTRAREEQADFYADEIIEIADKAKDANKARLQVDARKWYASKLAPKKYGEKLTQQHTGPDGGPIETKELSDIEEARRAAFVLQRAARSRLEGTESGNPSTD
jgi:hypothetical protein